MVPERAPGELGEAGMRSLVGEVVRAQLPLPDGFLLLGGLSKFLSQHPLRDHNIYTLVPSNRHLNRNSGQMLINSPRGGL